MRKGRRGFPVVCHTCGKEFLKEKYEIERVERQFCNIKCTAPISRINLGARLGVGRPELLRKGSEPDEFSPFRRHLLSATERGKRHKRVCSVTLMDLKEQWDKQNGKCVYTGWSLVNPDSTNVIKGYSIKVGKFRASLDRIDNSRGYEIGNIQFVSFLINVTKYTSSHAEFVDICRIVAERHPRSASI